MESQSSLKWPKWINSGNYDASVKEALAAMLEVFGIVFVEEVLDADIEALIQKRQEARANRDFATADQIRDQLAAQGIKLLDTKDGVRWTVIDVNLINGIALAFEGDAVYSMYIRQPSHPQRYDQAQ